MDVLQLVAKGLSYQEISGVLSLEARQMGLLE
jgi:DNA-binding CsgD family transcriptional regulator